MGPHIRSGKVSARANGVNVEKQDVISLNRTQELFLHTRASQRRAKVLLHTEFVSRFHEYRQHDADPRYISVTFDLCFLERTHIK
jgi:hypothetical protein